MKLTGRRHRRLVAPRARTAATFAVVLAAAVFAAWRIWDIDRLDAWIPEIVVALLTFAATVTLVEGIVQREQREQFGDWRGRVYGDIRFALQSYSWSVAIAYASSHQRTFKQPPTDVLDLLDFWRDQYPWQDIRPVAYPDDGLGVSLILDSGAELVDTLRRCRERDERAIPPKLVHAIDGVIGTAGLPYEAPDLRGRPASEIELIERDVVSRVRTFANVFLAEDPTDIPSRMLESLVGTLASDRDGELLSLGTSLDEVMVADLSH